MSFFAFLLFLGQNKLLIHKALITWAFGWKWWFWGRIDDLTENATFYLWEGWILEPLQTLIKSRITKYELVGLTSNDVQLANIPLELPVDFLLTKTCYPKSVTCIISTNILYITIPASLICELSSNAASNDGGLT